MSSSSKRYTCDFYQCSCLASDASLPEKTPTQLIDDLASLYISDVAACVREIKGIVYEVRIEKVDDSTFQGVAYKYRKADLPTAGVPGGEERDIDLLENEGIVEKSHFAFFPMFNVLILQKNFLAVSASRLARYFSQGQYTVSLDPILATSDVSRLIRNEARIRWAQIRIARPTNPELFDSVENDFGNSIVNSLREGGGASINVITRGDGNSKDPEDRYLHNNFRNAISELMQKYDVQKADMSYEDEHGMVCPIDLVANRLRYFERIRYDGRSPAKARMFELLRTAHEDKASEISEYFGPDDPAQRIR